MIREACISDFSGISTLENQVFQIHLDARPDMIKPELPFNQNYFEECLHDENMKIFVFEDAGCIIGYCVTRKIEHKGHYMFFDMIILEINNLCVDERVRCKNIGRQLFNHVKEYADAIGASRLELSVWAFNENAIQFYKRLGMSERTSRFELVL